MWGSWQRRIVRRVLFALMLSLLAASTPGAFAEDAKPLKGMALIIGQTKYEHLPALPNPGNDARAIGKLLTDLGFDVVPVPDADAKKLKRALQRFVEDAADADVALIYYSGHGIEAGGENYLIPVDAGITSLEDAGERLVPLSGILNELQQTAKITIMLLDACRSNPFPAHAKIITPSAPQGIAIGGQGLAATKGVVPVDEGTASDSFGQVIGFAAEPGAPALDGKPGGNSPYAAALLKHLAANRGYEFGQVMTLVAEEVYLSTQAMQRPWTNGSLRRFLNFGLNPEENTSDEALIRDTRRKLLVTIAATPLDTRGTVERVAKEKGISLAGMYDVLRALGQSDIPHEPEKIGKLLAEQADNIAKMMAERKALDAGDPEITRLAALADRAIDEGALPAARKFLDQAKAKIETGRMAVEGQRERLKAKDAADATIMARSAEAFERGFDYLAAANDYAKAYSYVIGSNPALAFSYKIEEADALSDHGNYKGDNDALRRSIASYQEAQRLAPRERVPRDWALTQNNLGNALWLLGERESGTGRLEEAVAAYRTVLEERTRERAPLDWAATQHNLGAALAELGERESGTAKLEEAIAAYRAVLEERTRERAPLDWAATQNNLGTALWKLGERESGTARLEEAVLAYRAALEESTRDHVPLDWARTQNNLGNTLSDLGERESGTARLEEAVLAHRAALEELPRARVPLDWASAQNSLGVALTNLGRRESSTARLEEAVAAYRAALEESTRDRVPLDWARTQNNLGTALGALSDIDGDAARLEESVMAFRAALEETTRERVPLYWAAIQHNLGNALQILGERESGTARLAEAVTAYRAALMERTRERVPLDWAGTQNSLGATLSTLGERESGTARLEEAVVAFRDALEELTREHVPLDWMRTQNKLGWILKVLGERKRDKQLVQSGKEAVEDSWKECKLAGYDCDQHYQERIDQFDAALAKLK